LESLQIPSNPVSSYRWLITDIDGTLIADDGSLPARNRDALAHCRELGIPVVLATGRRWTTLSRLLDRVNLHGLADFAVLNNGMLVKDLRAGRNLHCELFPREAFLQATAVLESRNLEPLVLAHDPDGRTDVFYRGLSLMNGDFVDKNAGHCREIPDFGALEGIPLAELILLGPEAELAQARDSLFHLPLEIALIRNTFYAGYMLEITPRGVSKFSGALRVADFLGAAMGEAVAIGDSANDLPLLRRVGRAVAMGNASEEVRLMAHETVSLAEEAGVAEAVFRHFPPD
jgi:Cof subfamily protein (haloacid dehalogenase superfamily)